MVILNRIFGFKIKDLYSVELKVQKCTGKEYAFESFAPPRHILVKKSKYDFYCKDIFTKTKYICNHDLVDKRSDFIVATNLTPFVATDNKVTYKEAQQILKNMNTHLSLKI